MVTKITFNLQMESLNDAFQDGNHSTEIARILRLMADGVANGAEGRFHLYDINGNRVGSAMLEVWED